MHRLSVLCVLALFPANTAQNQLWKRSWLFTFDFFQSKYCTLFCELQLFGSDVVPIEANGSEWDFDVGFFLWLLKFILDLFFKLVYCHLGRCTVPCFLLSFFPFPSSFYLFQFINYLTLPVFSGWNLLTNQQNLRVEKESQRWNELNRSESKSINEQITIQECQKYQCFMETCFI